MKFSMKFRMPTRIFLEREGEKEQAQLNLACKKFLNSSSQRVILLHKRARSSLHNNFPSANGTIIVSIPTSKNIARISKRETGEEGHNF